MQNADELTVHGFGEEWKRFDQSRVPGQVAGDALLCGVPTIGGNGAIEREIVPELVSDGQSFDALLERMLRLLSADAEYNRVVESMLNRARPVANSAKAAQRAASGS